MKSKTEYFKTTFDKTNAAPTLSGSAMQTIKVNFQSMTNARIKLLITKTKPEKIAALFQPMPDCTTTMFLARKMCAYELLPINQAHSNKFEIDVSVTSKYDTS